MRLYRCLYIPVFPLWQRPRIQHWGGPRNPLPLPTVLLVHQEPTLRIARHVPTSTGFYSVRLFKKQLFYALSGRRLCVYMNKYAVCWPPEAVPLPVMDLPWWVFNHFIGLWMYMSSSSKCSEVLVKEIFLPWLVGWCFEPSQPLGVTSGLFLPWFVGRSYIVEKWFK